MENDPRINPGESIQSSAKEKREARSVVRQSLREQRAKLKELRQGMRQGQDLGDDIDSCMGEIDLLLKELQAIEEGGHATFLEAKELIAPKKNVSSKKTNLRDEASDWSNVGKNSATGCWKLWKRPTSPRSARFRRSSTPCRRRRTSFSRTTRILF